MQKHPNLKPNSCGATARLAAPDTSVSASLPSSFEDWLHDDAQTPDLEAWAEKSSLRVAWNEQPVLTTSDTTYRTGYLGFLAKTPGDVEFDTFEAMTE